MENVIEEDIETTADERDNLQVQVMAVMMLN